MIRLLKNQWFTFLNALKFFTIIPLKIRLISPEKIIRYFSLTGIFTAAFSFVFYTVGMLFGGVQMATILALIAGVYFTGALHEDGFADTLDGIGGGWHKDQILSIMKDSRMGSFATIGLLFLMALKFICLSKIDPSKIFTTLLLGHMSSRGFAGFITLKTPYAHEKKNRIL